MYSITIRNLADSIKKRLRLQAALHGHSIEAEARDILRKGLKETKPPKNEFEGMSLGDAIHSLFKPLGGLELPEIERPPPREPPNFNE